MDTDFNTCISTILFAGRSPRPWPDPRRSNELQENGIQTLLCTVLVHCFLLCNVKQCCKLSCVKALFYLHFWLCSTNKSLVCMTCTLLCKNPISGRRETRDRLLVRCNFQLVIPHCLTCNPSGLDSNQECLEAV